MSASTIGVRIPIAAAMRRFWVTARIARPRRVTRKASIRSPTTAAVKAMIQSRLRVSVRPPTSMAPLIQVGEVTSTLVGPKSERTAC